MGAFGCVQKVGTQLNHLRMPCVSHPVHRSGLDGRNKAYCDWIDLNEHDCVVSGEVLWIHRAGMPWWPAQRMNWLASPKCLWREQHQQDKEDMQGSDLFHIFYEEIYHRPLRDVKVGFEAFGVRQVDNSYSKVSGCHHTALAQLTPIQERVLAYMQAVIEMEEQQSIRASAEHLPAHVLQHWAITGMYQPTPRNHLLTPPTLALLQWITPRFLSACLRMIRWMTPRRWLPALGPAFPPTC